MLVADDAGVEGLGQENIILCLASIIDQGEFVLIVVKAVAPAVDIAGQPAGNGISVQAGLRNRVCEQFLADLLLVFQQLARNDGVQRSLAGGEGTIIGAVIGAAIMAVLRNAFVLLKLPIYLQTITIGLVIIVAVAADNLRRRRR